MAPDREVAAMKRPSPSDWGSSGAKRRARSVSLFVRFLRWATALFVLATVITTVVLAVRAPNCIAIGVSVLRAQDCTNRDTYYLLLAAAAAVSICFSLLLLASAYALELLSVLGPGPLDAAEKQR